MEFINSLKDINTTSILIASLLVFPGFITIKIKRLIHAQREIPFSELVLDAAFYTIINYILNIWIIILYSDYQIKSIFCTTLLLVWIIIIFPAMLPFIGSYLLNSNFIKKITKVDPIPKPWDFCFSQKIHYWIIFHLKNGKKIGGYYGEKSFASSYPNDEQIYIQEVWNVSKKGKFKGKIERSNGLIVSMSEVSSIEFFKA